MRMGRRSPLLIPVIFWILGIVIGKYFCVSPLVLFALIGIGFILFFMTKYKNWVILILFLLLGVFRIQPTFPPNHIKKIIQNNAEILQPIRGQIVSEVVKYEKKYRFKLALSKIADAPVCGKIRFSTFQKGLKYGDVIETVATIKAIENNSNPAAFNYAKYSELQRIFALGFAKTKIKIIKNSPQQFQKRAIQIRKDIRHRIDAKFGEYAGFIKAVVIGDKNNSTEWRELMNRAGLSHLLAISGLHVGIIYLALMSLLSAFIPHRNFARILLMIILVFYAAICLWSPSVSRAMLMINLFLFAKIFQRKPDKNNILFAALLIITAVSPHQLFSVGLQMSFLAVFVMLNIVPKISFLKFTKDEIVFMKFGKKILNAACILFVSSLILNVFLAPIIVYYFQCFNFNGVVGNIVGIPLMSFILPVSLLMIFLPLPLILFLKSSFEFLMYFFEVWSNFSANLPFFNNFASINVVQLFAVYGLLFSVFWWKYIRKKVVKIILIITLLCVFLFFEVERQHKLKITFFDCGLGDLFLIETPQNQTILIDCGPPETNPKYFEKSALPYLRKSRISSIDYVLITHAHNDHYGGLEYILENLEVKNLILTDEFQSRKIWENYADLIEFEKCEIFTISDTTHLEFNDLKLKFIHPDKSFANKNINNLSIVMRCDYFDFSLLFTGDLESDGEKYLCKNYPEFLNCDFLKVCHHGSATSTMQEFVELITPKYAFISAPRKNRFNFPHQKTMQTLDFLGENLFIEGVDGALQIITNGKTAKFKTYFSKKEFVDNNLE
ncbi:MAG: DNA internalization-related competence protein ComEC/Rec2 [Candidatus Cloacimonetes bacterium]|nr:DNA internalization-related competence protein ComEC/Rec2 [Candidatus Cloacimonadota bacterium]